MSVCDIGPRPRPPFVRGALRGARVVGRRRGPVVAMLGLVVAAAPGCAVVSVAGATAGAAISVTGAVVATGVRVTGKVVEKTVDLVVP